jgi:hypothetical protein
MGGDREGRLVMGGSVSLVLVWGVLVMLLGLGYWLNRRVPEPLPLDPDEEGEARDWRAHHPAGR